MRKGDVCFVVSPQFGGISGHGQKLKLRRRHQEGVYACQESIKFIL